MTIIPWNQRAWVDDLEQPDYEDSCPECWSKETCDACLVWQEQHRDSVPDDHDRRFSEVYDGRTDIGDQDLPF